MSAEIHEEAAMMASPHYNSSSSVSNDECSSGVVKGKRTKRQRQFHQSSTPTPAVASWSTSSSSSGDHSGSATEEEEDMANCLILLARGRALVDAHSKPRQTGEEAVVRETTAGERFTSRRLAEAGTTTNGKVGFYVYECKTCSKCFPSFQALGGHRASHKKSNKTAPVATVMTVDDREKYKSGREDVLPIRNMALHPNSDGVNGKSGVSTAVGNNKSRMHECSICGLEFSSGQALGGHMRRHRTTATAETAATVPEPLQQEAKKEKTILCLDLNLPAPMEEERGDLPKVPSFPTFPAAKQTLIFSGSALVDCHY